MSDPRSDEMAGFRVRASTLLQRIQHGLSNPPFELVDVPHSGWPRPQAHPTQRPLQILVLDASFNPPTRAHLALADSPQPSQWKHVSARASAAQANDATHYDAKLLLLSVRNADKSLKPGDATYLQRLEMMKIFSEDVRQQHSRSDGEETSNVAIGIIDEPTFVGKSSMLQAFFRSRAAESPEDPTYHIQLNFILGFDTLERLIQPRYYGSREQMIVSLRKFFSPVPEGDDSRVICAQRGSPSSPEGMAGSTDLAVAEEFMSAGRIVMIDIGEELRTYSSTEVRNTIRRLGLEATEWKKFVPNGIADFIVHEKLYINEA
ncbi:putative NAD biosynthesis via nicotinamide riboside salvage pathway [Lyophyllum shimeji]|uniref:NAD biosynthesis via nicotinamide riboside salvage pathway n=1 Tax=Lyophyllum shimeji TaxID=47721 RepID=A0A9P3UQM7_LYOSH|nr:putative NAD biosynthesis via nicotinamide riboside salvage pathway [Lyophyllum shimeji]